MPINLQASPHSIGGVRKKLEDGVSGGDNSDCRCLSPHSAMHLLMASKNASWRLPSVALVFFLRENGSVSGMHCRCTRRHNRVPYLLLCAAEKPERHHSFIQRLCQFKC